jgi:cell wall-associated NlpC family hydrolase
VTQLTAPAIAAFAKAAGFRDEALAIAVAIALAESSGDPKAVNPDSGALGLWQVVPRWHPTYSKPSLLTPEGSALAAWEISGFGNSWGGGKWTTYDDNEYLTFMPQADAASHSAITYIPGHLRKPQEAQTVFATDWPTGLDHLTLNRESLGEDLRDAVSDVRIDQRLDGASSIEVDFHDPHGAILAKGPWTTATTVTLFGRTFSFCRLDKEDQILTAGFEDSLVAKLRNATGSLRANAGTTTNPQFAASLVQAVQGIFYGCPDQLIGIGVKRGTVLAKEQIERQTISGERPETSWECLGRLAGDLNWRRFSDGRVLWYGPDVWLRAHVAHTVKVTQGTAGVGLINFTWDPRIKTGNEASFTLDGGKLWRPVVGQSVTLVKQGPASTGDPWLVNEISRSLFSTRAKVTLSRAQVDKPAGSSAGLDDGSVTSAKLVGTKRGRIVEYANSQLGVPYLWGGYSPAGWDCSGLVQISYAEAGVIWNGGGKISAQAEYNLCQIVADKDRLPGDIAFFSFASHTAQAIDHCGIYIGGKDAMIAAPDTGTVVQVQDGISSWDGYMGCGRPR